MFKNTVIAMQATIIGFGILWAFIYMHRVEQIFVVSQLGHLANQTRFMAKIEARIAAGQTSTAQSILKSTIRTSTDEMVELTGQLDLEMKDLISTSREYAAIPHAVGIDDVSAAIEARVVAAGESP